CIDSCAAELIVGPKCHDGLQCFGIAFEDCASEITDWVAPELARCCFDGGHRMPDCAASLAIYLACSLLHVLQPVWLECIVEIVIPLRNLFRCGAFAIFQTFFKIQAFINVLTKRWIILISGCCMSSLRKSHK